MTNLLKVLVCCAVVMTAGCESLSRWKTAGTRTLVSFIPREVDQKLGEVAEKTSSTGLSSSPVPNEAQQLIQTLAEPLTRSVDLSPLNPQIGVVRSNIPNAYAFPHGGIFVTSKLLEISKTPDEILAVLAHELAHVAQRHSMQQMVTQLGTTLAINLMFGDFGALADIAGTGGQLLGLKFSRDHEREADSYGADILRRAQLPLGGMAGFFERMQEYEKSKLDLTSDNKMLSMLMTHPPTQERIDAARQLVSDSNLKVPAEQAKAYQKLKEMLK